jgi:hypothetical protein
MRAVLFAKSLFNRHMPAGEAFSVPLAGVVYLPYL